MDDLRRRLRRLGVTTGHEFKPKLRAVPGIDALLDGRVLETANGACFAVTHTYAPQTRHGAMALSDWLTLGPAALAGIGGDSALNRVDPRRYVFIDTETTGLGGGALAFLVGIGYFNAADHFEMHQFFLRDPAEEPALLTLLHERLWPDGGLVTFNGRRFDVPLLGGRFIRNRMPTHIHRMPNLDLLAPARRLWQRRLPSCALSALEGDILGLQRSEADVPGYLIPALYGDYLRTGDASQMRRVFYHNEQDLLSMAALGVRLCRIFERPDASTLLPDDRLSLARWYHNQGMLDKCEVAYRVAVDEAPDAESRYDALHGLAYLLKRAGRREEAVPLWQDLADLKLDVLGHEELAKHYEWHATDLSQAMRWTEAGIALASSWRPGIRQRQALNDLAHRQRRLLRKLNNRSTPSDENLEE
jgi:uncharacterized protein YprB with RNaseH-like and TPR domain